MSLGELGRVGILVPVHERLLIVVVLLETYELLLKDNSSSVAEVVSWVAVEVFSSVPLLPSALLSEKDFV